MDMKKVFLNIHDAYKKKKISPSDLENFCKEFLPFAEYVLIKSKIKYIIINGGELADFKWLVMRMERLERRLNEQKRIDDKKE